MQPQPGVPHREENPSKNPWTAFQLYMYNNNNIIYSSPGVNDNKTFLPRHLKIRKSIHNTNAHRHVRRLNDNIYSYPFNHIYTQIGYKQLLYAILKSTYQKRHPVSVS